MADVYDRIESAIKDNQVMLFMKGNPSFPRCGFSAAAIEILEEMGVDFETADVLTDPELREAIKIYSNWPTIPQIYINGKFIGGSDILRELYETGELQTLLGVASEQAR